MSRADDPGKGNTVRVLLVDARPVMLRGLAQLIDAQRPQMEVVGQATTYARAIAMTEQLRPDVLLVSFLRDTLDPLNAIDVLLRYRGSKVLLLKSLHEDAPVGRALRMGAAGVVIAEDPTHSIVEAIRQVHEGDPAGPSAWVGGISHSADSRIPIKINPVDPVSSLTAREKQLIQALVANPSAKYIAIGAKLGISEHTVHNHLSSIYHKLNVINRADLLVYAVRHRLVGDDDAASSGWVALR